MTRSGLDALARLRCRVVRHRLGPGAAPTDVVRAACGSAGLVALIGAWAGGGAVVTADPVLVLPAGLDPIAALAVQPAVLDADPDVVGGGWFGSLAYDGPSRLAFHDHLLRHRDGTWWFEALWSDERDALLQARLEEAPALLDGAPSPSWRVGTFDGWGNGATGTADRGPDSTAAAGSDALAAARSDAVAPGRHLAAVERAIELIRAGELYQVNVCTRLQAPFSGSAVGLFADAVDALTPVYGAYLGPGRGDGARASLSPELFLRRRGRDVWTGPIKGTAPRTGTAAGTDESDGAETLRRSSKDAAENVMIVDLMRNDLGRVCSVGSVRVPSLLDIEPHPGVWHLVSTVTGRLAPGVDDAELLRATFPPGSVTGAPKSRAVQVIGRLEDGPRGAYTGAIGFASPSWGAEFSVAIRTFELGDGRIELGVGGGVTADSVPVLEWRECLHKAAPLLGALGATVGDSVRTPDVAPTAEQLAGGVLETLLAVDGVVLRTADHLARLDRSVRELYGVALAPSTASLVGAVVAGTRGRVAVRVVVTAGSGGSAQVTAAPARPRPEASAARLVPGRSGLWRHKWADRGYLAAAEREFVPLFLAADGAVLETSRGNVFLLTGDGELVTSPLRDDVLPGVTRRALLDLARDEGRPTHLRTFAVEELRGCVAFWTSSLSLAVPIATVDGFALPRRDDLLRTWAAQLSAGVRGRANPIGIPTVR